MLSRRHFFDILLVSRLREDLIGSFPQRSSVVVRERSIANFDKVMVEGGVGVLRRADGYIGEL